MARQKLGQHFLIKGSICDRIARTACPEREPVVVEIGPGRGDLTRALLAHADRVIAIELDPYLASMIRGKASEEPRLTVIDGDALEVDLAQWGPVAMAGNLPYYAATPIMERALRLGPLLKRGVFLVQKEVALRAAAKPGSRDYGYLSVSMQLAADVEVIFEVKPAAFHPPPKVDSALVRLTPRDRAKELGIADARGLLRFVGLCFHQKRKTLRNNLSATYGAAVDAWPEGRLRAEQIDIPTFAELYRRLLP